MSFVNPLKNLVFAGYRRLFRARKVAFGADVNALTTTRIALRDEFEKYRHVQDQHTIGTFIGQNLIEDIYFRILDFASKLSDLDCFVQFF